MPAFLATPVPGAPRPAGSRAWARVAAVALMALVVSLVGCGRNAPAVPADEASRAQVLIDSGNQAFSAGNFGLAARRYAAAAVIKKDDPAAYYGLGMALSRLGRDEEARAAYARARELSRP